VSRAMNKREEQLAGVVRNGRMLIRIPALVLLALALAAVEVPATVLYVFDGDTIRAKLASGAEEIIRLNWIDTPESKDNEHGSAMTEGKFATATLRKMLPIGATIRLWGPELMLNEDMHGRKLALVLLGNAGEDSAQERQVRGGWSVYWRKFGEAPGPWHKRLLAAQAAAEEAKVGAWATVPQWMRDKGNERTAQRR